MGNQAFYHPISIGELWEYLEAMAQATKDHEIRERLYEISFYPGYAEPGYDDPPSGIVALGDWNLIYWGGKPPEGAKDYRDNTLPRIAAILEKRYGVALEWCDEWMNCSGCSKLVRTSPNCYGWQPSHGVLDGDVCCLSCLNKDEDLMKEYLESMEGRGIAMDEINLEKYGYVQLNDTKYEQGLYGGQDDSPEEIAQVLRNKGARRFLFKLDSVGQFDSHFSVYIHEDEYDTYLLNPQGKSAIDPATAMQMALKSATLQMATIEGEGIKYAQCHPDGTASVRIVSPEEFIKGIKPSSYP